MEDCAMTEVSNVGQLRAALEGLPDDRPILAQVVATNGQAWNLQCEFTAEPKFLKWAAVMTMKHHELTSLTWPTSSAGETQ
jgi:hypothetical protein